MKITTQDQFDDFEITETLGLVRGNTIRARHIGKDILASIRTVVGGEITEYTKMLAESREQALDRMVNEAKRFGAERFCLFRDDIPKRQTVVLFDSASLNFNSAT